MIRAIFVGISTKIESNYIVSIVALLYKVPEEAGGYSNTMNIPNVKHKILKIGHAWPKMR